MRHKLMRFHLFLKNRMPYNDIKKESVKHMVHFKREISLPPDIRFFIYLDDSLEDKLKKYGLDSNFLVGDSSKVYPVVDNGFYTVFNSDYHVFFLLYKENEHVLIKTIDKVNYFVENNQISHTNFFSFDNYHFLTDSPKFIFLRNVYWNESQMSVELSSNLLLKLRMLNSLGFGEGKLCSLFTKPIAKIKDGFYSLYSPEHYIYIVFELNNEKIYIREILRTDFYSSGLEILMSKKD